MRVKLLFPVAVVMVLTGGVEAAKFGRALEHSLVEELSSKGVALAKSLASEAQETLLTRDASTIQGFIDEYKVIHGVAYVYVIDAQGQVIAHTFSPSFPEEIFPKELKLQPSSARINLRELRWRSRRLLDVEAPILAGTLGFAHMGMDVAFAEETAWRAIREALTVSLLVSVLGMICVVFFLNRTIRRVIRLSSVSREIAQGESFDPAAIQIQIDAGGSDEIALLSANFSKMITELGERRASLEKQVSERTLKLRLANQELESENVARRKIEGALRQESRFVGVLQKSAIAANESRSTEEVLLATLKIVCEAFDYQLGHVLLRNGESLVSANIWYYSGSKDLSEFKRNSAGTFETGLGLPGRVLQSGTTGAISITDSPSGTHFPRQRCAEALGFKGAVAFPLPVNQRVEAVMEFFSLNPIPENAQLFSVLTNVGIQVGRVLERARANEQLENQRIKLAGTAKMSSLGEMAGGIAHEINSPLATIKSLSSQVEELIQEEPIDRTLVMERAKKIGKTTDRIAKIIQGLRTFSRDGSEDPFISVNVSQLVDETLSFCKERFQKHGTEVSVVPISPDLYFEGRATQISQVLLNLVHNADDAIRALEQKWIRIEARENAGRVEISVTDSGRGISADTQKRLFQPFFTTKEIGKGTGMGLSISIGIVKAHGGSLTLDNTSENTRFVVSIPQRHVPT
ncbi:MAG: ATP-binding protein [Bdellovibrionota bacterium]